MGKFTPYDLLLRGLAEGKHQFSYRLDDAFFTAIDGDQVRKGDVDVEVGVKRYGLNFDITFNLTGYVKIPCDRCLDEMVQEVESNEFLIVKLGAEYGEEGDNIVIIPEVEGVLNIAWFMFEFIVLTIPIKHVHPKGLCNKEVSAKLRKHSARKSDEEDDELPVGDQDFVVEEKDNDPRWDGLKQLLDN